jgi:uncharacterized protein YmfQ (DUF2313 family)
MKTSFHTAAGAFLLTGALVLTVPAIAGARSESSEQWNQGQAELQKNLSPGQPADAYRRKLENLGYKVTSVNYDKPDYLEYEVVKGDQTWEVQVDVDQDTHRATKVDVVQNLWKTDATKAALEDNRRVATNDESAYHGDRRAGDHDYTSAERRRTAEARNNQYSDRDRTSTSQLVKEIEGLPTGHDKQYYKEALRKRGYDIARVDKDDTDQMKLEAVKDGRSVKVDIDFDEDTGRSTKVNASSLWAESEATTRTREAQTGEPSRAVPEHRTSDTERRSQADTYHNR